MTADIVEFPARPAGEPVRVRRFAAAGDIVVLCLNATVGLWAAWPVAAVDDDGVVMGVTNRAGKMLGVGRLNCAPDVLAFRAADHDPEAFAALRWRTWMDQGDAVIAFAEIARSRDV
ncbi:hypothetical protein A4249_01350 [Brevundimonas sp. GW460-12-10-14-LB2]|uniref:hypothetical protein n=1 Tax=Brevundimonas sp. GW460-12-10-14-LB2 TaxID=1827469 RepID=UPI0007BC9FB1|nr:hypothetical protein [Brevundimonas sp. GW460-12-10-14-LB2]ANC52445.1 hypothetical protein A4249_01350 [Brevundimonas sp. GW460-12-10-14-LB2]